MNARRGFTLLEVMIAVSIAAIGIVSLLELFGGSMRLARAASDQTKAIVIASSVMDSVLWKPELPEGGDAGDIGDYHWVMDVRPVDPELGSTADEPLEDISESYELYEITIEVSWGQSDTPRQIRLRSRRLMERF
jgi:prepilin-type N-terminal cleavage/methylation domain-containing protein